MAEQTKTFETGQTYYARFISDYDKIIKGTVVKRTPKTINLQLGHGAAAVKRRIKVMDGVEYVMPLGNYSMAPMMEADKVIKE